MACQILLRIINFNSPVNGSVNNRRICFDIFPNLYKIVKSKQDNF